MSDLTTNLIPANNLVLVEIKTEEQAAGSIIVVKQAQDRQRKAKVLRVGPGKFDSRLKQRISPSIYAGQTILVLMTKVERIGATDHYLVDADDILGTIGE